MNTIDRTRWTREIPGLLALALLTLGVFFSKSSLEQGGWRWDDPQILLAAQQFSPWAYCFDPTVWQQVSAAHFTPWMVLSLDLDLWLFGDECAGYYWHQATSFCLLVGVLFVTMRHILPQRPLAAYFTVLLFLASPAVHVTFEQLMARHYVEGLIFILLAWLGYQWAQQRQRIGYALLGAICYLLAACSKEIFVPWVLLLPWLGAAPWRQRLGILAPFAVAAALYALWRIDMLGTPVGGYAHQTPWLTLAYQTLIELPRFAWRYLFGEAPWAIAAGLSALALLGWQAVHSERRLLWWLTPLLLVLPLAPVSGFASGDLTNIHAGRYLLLPALVLAIALGSASANLFKRNPRWIVVPALLLLTGTWQSLLLRAQAQGEIALFESIGHSLWNQGQDRILWTELEHYHFFVSGIRGLKRLLKPGTAMPDIAADPIQLPDPLLDARPVYAFSPDDRRLTEQSARFRALRAQWQQQLRDAPLSLDVVLDAGNLLHFRFGPHAEGRYAVVSSELGRLYLPREGYERFGIHDFSLQVQYQAPAGWITYSPLLDVHLEPGKPFHWER